LARSHEYSSYIIEAIETHKPVTIYGNVANQGYIENLPRGSCVEVPCLVDGNGIQPVPVGVLPAQLAALNRTNISVQELTVQVALTGDREAIFHALSLDPLTAAVCTLPEIRRLGSALLAAQAAWLPQFA
jgi:alpha-galactosidase